MLKNCIKSINLFIFIFLAGCSPKNFSQLAKSPVPFFQDRFGLNGKENIAITDGHASIPLPLIVDSAALSVNVNEGFKSAVASAIKYDPLVIAAKREHASRMASINVIKSQKEFQTSGTVYGGVEDVTDRTAGLALVLNASKLVYDGNLLDQQISAEEFGAEAALQRYYSVIDEQALDAMAAWLDYEKYSDLLELINSRLVVLDPLIKQLEQVADAGLGDMSQVASAQRTVSLIRVTQTDVEERLQQARVHFLSIFGSLPTDVKYNSSLITGAVPQILDEREALEAPALLAGYASYEAAIASLKAVEAKDEVSVGFEAKIQRPALGSGYDSDESFGLVVRKTLYDGNKLSAELNAAKAQVDAQLEYLRATYRKGKRGVESAQQTIVSMDKAIALARDNAQNSKEEISYLRQQLIIGQSTLESVLSAEARMYDAESKEVGFIAERRLAEIKILAAMGLLSTTLDLR